MTERPYHAARPLLPIFALVVLASCTAVRAPEGAPPGPTAAQPSTSAAPVASVDERYLEEISRLSSTPAVRAAFRRIEELEPRTAREHVELTEIPAPPFKEEARAARFAEMLREAGADSVWIDEVGNVLALRRGTGGGETVVVSGHIDTVFPEGTDVTVRAKGDTLFAPGIGDDSRGLVVLLTMLRAMADTDLRARGDLLFVGTVGEEGLGDLRGVKHLFRDGGPRIDAFISVDTNGDETIVNQALGSRRYRVTFHGPGGHSWGAFGLGHPAHALGRAIHRFDERAAEFTSTGARTSYSVGRIGGGTSVNSIPSSVWMEVDMRSENQGRLKEIDELFRETMRLALEEQNRARRSGEPLTLELDLVGDRPSGTTEPTHPFVQRAMAAARHLGAEPRLQMSSTDANVPISLGIPAVTTGRGGIGGKAHSPDEWWIGRDSHRAIQRTLLLALAQAGLAD